MKSANIFDFLFHIGYPNFGKLLNKTDRPMVYSCSWPVYEESDDILVYIVLDRKYLPKQVLVPLKCRVFQPNFELIKETCNLWRNYGDIDDSWDTMTSITNYFAENQDRIQPNAGPGHWNDPDMLIIGNFGLSFEQSKAQMAVWAILAAPLIMSTDLDRISKESADILLNQQVFE